MAKIFIIEDEKVAAAIEMLLEKKNRLNQINRKKIHPFSDYEPNYVRPSSGCGMTYSSYGGCGGTFIHSSGCGNSCRSGCGGTFIHSSGCGSSCSSGCGGTFIHSSGCGSSCRSGCGGCYTFGTCG